MSTPRPRRPRADARRNYERLLAVADTAFREHGTAAPLDGIARQAGVAIGTLYGHFPNRVALAGALLRERHGTLFAFGEELLTHASAQEGLSGWIRAVVAHAAAYRGLAGLLAEGRGDETSELHASCLRMADLTDRLVARAHEAGVVRDDATGDDVSALMNAAAWASEQVPREQADRLVNFLISGLRPESVH
ncbi:TetR/AcrR family transcriptional regulator [Streptomyces sp. NBC_00370]|uniref:TetR/AcrR family transcriptional regulator n=1 Tax=Streptomyces sp. NBC_00370 TaxID=2975728 RepID=UPI002E26DB65